MSTLRHDQENPSTSLAAVKSRRCPQCHDTDNGVTWLWTSPFVASGFLQRPVINLHMKLYWGCCSQSHRQFTSVSLLKSMFAVVTTFWYNGSTCIPHMRRLPWDYHPMSLFMAWWSLSRSLNACRASFKLYECMLSVPLSKLDEGMPKLTNRFLSPHSLHSPPDVLQEQQPATPDCVKLWVRAVPTTCIEITLIIHTSSYWENPENGIMSLCWMSYAHSTLKLSYNDIPCWTKLPNCLVRLVHKLSKCTLNIKLDIQVVL